MQALLNDLNFLTSENLNATTYFLKKKNNEYSLHKTDIEDSLSGEIANLYASSLLEALREDGLVLKDYSTADARKNVIYKYNLEEEAREFEFIREAINDTTGIVAPFSFNIDGYDYIFGIVVVIDDGTNRIALFKRQASVNIIKRGKRIFMKYSDTRLEAFNETILALPGTTDLFLFNDTFFLINIDVLERCLGLHQVIFTQAKGCLSKLKDLNLIEDMVPITNAATNIRFAKKLISAVPNSPVLTIAPEAVIQFSKQHATLSAKFKYNKAGNKFNLKSLNSQMLFIKLLNDDYLKSELTRIDYETLAKDKLTPSEV